MDEAKFARGGLLAGVGAAVLLVVSGLLAGGPPMITDSDGKIVNFLTDKADALKIGSYLGGLGALLLLWFLGSLYGKLRTAEGGSGRLSRVGLTGGIIAIAVVLGALALQANAALVPSSGAYGYRLSFQFFGYVGFAMAVFVSAVSVVIWNSGLLPKWFGYVGEVIAVGWLVGAAAVSTTNDAIAVIGFVVFLVWTFWLAALSVMLYQQDA